MKTLDQARRDALIKQANLLLDDIEKDLAFIINSIKAKNENKAA